MLFVMIMILLLLFGGFGFMIYLMFFKNRKEQKEEKEKFIPTTQDQIPIESIEKDLVKLKNGGYRLIIELPSINIDLMEPEERESILQQYRKVLNSITFPFQYLQQSRVVDIGEYLNKLSEKRAVAKNKFIRNQLEFYSSYLVDLIKTRNILTKKFYIVVPYDDARENAEKKDYQAFGKSKKAPSREPSEEQIFERAKKTLESRGAIIQRSFRRFDIHPKRLNNKELLELYYTSYNKNRSVHQGLRDKDPADYTSLYVKREEGDYEKRR